MSTKGDVYKELSRVLKQIDFQGCTPEFCNEFEQRKKEMVRAILADLPSNHVLGPKGEKALSNIRNLIQKEGQ